MTKRFLFLICFAFVLRFAWIFLLAPLLGFGVYVHIDGDGYLPLAKAFHNGEFLTNPNHVLRVPLYPSMLAFVTLFPLDPLSLLRFWQILIDLLTLSCVYLFTRKYFGSRQALIAGYLYALYPLGIYRLAMLNTENIQAAAIVFWIMGITLFWETQRIRHAVLLALLTAVVIYLNPAFQFIPFFLVFALVIRKPSGQSIRLAAAFLLPLILICSLWGLRNYTLTGDFFFFDVRGGKEFWLGNHQTYQGRWEGPLKEEWQKDLSLYYDRVKQQGGTENDCNSFMYKKGIENIRQNPAGAVLLDIKKFFRYWYVPASETMLKLTIPVQSFYLFFMLWGLLLKRLRSPSVTIPFLIITYSCLIYTVSYACIRFSHPIMPWVCVLASIGIASFLAKWKGQESE